ncbi:hypothetical protein [Massilia sp. Leaf139]|uniref:hypothetical protein n=1 Tax=Massilia sp. Leaf139 TaxID=1736272 RepID=UPI0006F88A5E|nr:hypothetical protein [Massilia sp. Leaf139]KQQ86445.1 hypothetical protein ASF77_20970 [Massilia sp. Leaf139]
MSVRADGLSDLLFGLNSDPDTDSHWSSLDFAIETRVNGGLYVWESGVARGGLVGTYGAGDTLSIVHDGSAVRYCKNGIQQFVTYLPTPVNSPLFFDSSINTVGASLSNIRLGPLSSNNWALVGGTGKPQDGATVGAPAGTNVGSTPATTVEAQAAAAIPKKTMTVSITGTLSSLVNNGTQNYGLLIANVSGTFKAPLSYRWSCTGESDNGIATVNYFVSGDTAADRINVKGTATNMKINGQVTLEVTDADGITTRTTRGHGPTHGTYTSA